MLPQLDRAGEWGEAGSKSRLRKTGSYRSHVNQSSTCFCSAISGMKKIITVNHAADRVDQENG
jgi:hypothetical protein